jgi:hypothetical protein
MASSLGAASPSASARGVVDQAPAVAEAVSVRDRGTPRPRSVFRKVRRVRIVTATIVAPAKLTARTLSWWKWS